MSWRSEDLVLKEKPEFGNTYLFGEEALEIEKNSSITDKIFANNNAAYQALFKQVAKNSAGFAAVIDESSFSVTKPLKLKYSSLLKDIIRYHKFELGKLKQSYSKPAKTCPTCRTRYTNTDGDSVFELTAERVLSITESIQQFEDILFSQDTLHETILLDLDMNTTGVSCSLCRHEHVMMTIPSSKRAIELRDKINEKKKEFVAMRNELATKQGLKKSSKLRFLALGLIHDH